jgi:hypothetical protein
MNLKAIVGIAALLVSYPLAAQAALVLEIEGNDTLATAQNINGNFTLDFSPNIGDFTSNTSTTIPHVTVRGTGNGTFDVYSFSTGGGLAIFDIDVFGTPIGNPSVGGLPDPFLRLFDAGGISILSDDDNVASYGQGGSADHYGVDFSFDSYIQLNLAPGNYFIRVGSCCEGPASSGTYELQVSVTNAQAVPEPGTLGMFALGLAMACVAGRRHLARAVSA